MALFSRPKKSTKSTDASTEVKVVDAHAGHDHADHVHEDVVAPKEPTSPARARVSEKASLLATKSQYVFQIPVAFSKIEVRKMIEAKYKVNVLRVNIVRGTGKVVRRGKQTGRRSNWKKAIIFLKKGEKLEIHSGV